MPDDIRACAQRFYRPGDWSNTPPDTPVWVVKVEGIPRSLSGGGEPWRYVMNVLHAESGSSMEGARYHEPRLAPAVRDGSWGPAWSMTPGERDRNGTFRITVKIADPRGQHFEPVEMLVDTGATFTKVPKDLLQRLAVTVESTYTAVLADGRRVEWTRGRTVIRLEGKEFPTPVTFGEDGEQSLLGAMALEDAMPAVDPHSRRLIPVDAREMTETAE